MPLATLTLTIAIVWILMKGETSPANFFVGFILALAMVVFLRKTYDQERSFRRGGEIVRYVLSFLRELVIANLQVMRIVLSPRLRIRPGILAYRTQCRTPLGVTILANSITLTPGTLSVDVSDDASTIFVHTLNIDDPDQVREGIRRGLEEPVVRAVE